jgi:hypothetical protein
MKEELIVDRNQMNIVNEMTIEIIEFIKRKIGLEQEGEKRKVIYHDDEETIDPIFGNDISIDLFVARNVIRIIVLRDIIKKTKQLRLNERKSKKRSQCERITKKTQFRRDLLGKME